MSRKTSSAFVKNLACLLYPSWHKAIHVACIHSSWPWIVS